MLQKYFPRKKFRIIKLVGVISDYGVDNKGESYYIEREQYANGMVFHVTSGST